MDNADTGKVRCFGVIVAAGLSSRMGSFKPTLPIGQTTFIRRIICVMQRAGLDGIIVVGGARADELSAHLSGERVKLLINPDYATTEMLTSFQIALRFAAGAGADAVVFTPVDIVLPGEEIYRALLNADTDADCVRPSYQGRSGHPVLIRKRVFERILSYTGEGGLKGALRGADVRHAWVNVDDPGIFMDADTPEEYEKIRRMAEDTDAPDQGAQGSGNIDKRTENG